MKGLRCVEAETGANGIHSSYNGGTSLCTICTIEQNIQKRYGNTTSAEKVLTRISSLKVLVTPKIQT
jgi:hypothetical protein